MPGAVGGWVAPLAGSVDRNAEQLKLKVTYNGRSPRGERG